MSSFLPQLNNADIIKNDDATLRVSASSQTQLPSIQAGRGSGRATPSSRPPTAPRTPSTRLRRRSSHLAGSHASGIDASFTRALAAMDATENPTLLASSIKALIKMLTNICKRPNDKKQRKVRTANMMVRKYVDQIAGACAFLKVAGFSRSEMGPKKTEYLWMENVDHGKLTRAVQLLKDKLTATEHKAKEYQELMQRKEEAMHLLACLDGCGYLAEEKLGGYCSVCFERRYYREIAIPTWKGKTSNSVAIPNVIFVSNCDVVAPHPCVTGCGFFGLTFMGMCGQCWQLETKAHTVRQKTWREKLCAARVKLNALFRFKSAPRLQQKKKNRCWKCKRRVGITGIQCRCGFIFCGVHRYPEVHECYFDHKDLQRQTLRKSNPVVKKSKFDRIESDDEQDYMEPPADYEDY